MKHTGVGPPSRISVVIPARNEGSRIGAVIAEAQSYAGEVVVVDDCSSDDTGAVASGLGARVVANELKAGYLGAIKTGFRRATGEIVVTLDADGEHDPRDIPRLVEPILAGDADLVLGRRPEIARFSERLINRLTNLRVRVADSGTGYRAVRTDLARTLELNAPCTCGILVLEAHSLGARTTEVPVSIRTTGKPRRIVWAHAGTIARVLLWLVSRR
jgi:glycosyltransferase involved in cell wall biosynthesis